MSTPYPKEFRRDVVAVARQGDQSIAEIARRATIFPNSSKRGSGTFMPIADFPFQERRKGRRLADNLVELCVIGGVHDIEDFMIRVERRQGADVIEPVYES